MSNTNKIPFKYKIYHADINCLRTDGRTTPIIERPEGLREYKMTKKTPIKWFPFPAD
jgi:hypothetical protein